MRHWRTSRQVRSVLCGLALLALDATWCRSAEEEIAFVVGDPAHGRDVTIEKGCISCHAVRGAGGKVGPDLAAALVGNGIVGIAAAMLNHYPKMSAAMAHQQVTPPHLDPAEMDDVVTYLLFINFAREPGSPEAGRTLFSQKGCIKCHALVPGGTSLGPPLGRASLSAPPILIAQAMWNHGTQMTATMQRLRIERATFEGHQMADLLAFLGGTTEPLPRRGAALPGTPALGRELFQSKGCARCHRTGQTGESIGPDLVAGHWYKTATEIAGAMWNHGPAMWARMSAMGISASRFEDDEMADVIAYLYLLRSADGPGVPERGGTLFSEKHCARCHEAGGPGPDLTAAEHLDTPIHFAAEMWNHAPRMHAFVTDAGLPWPAFTASEVNDLVSYLRQHRAVQHPATPQPF